MSEQSSRQNSNLQQTHGSKVVAQVQLRPATEIACSERWRTVGLLFPFPAITPKCVSACCPPHDWRPHRTMRERGQVSSRDDVKRTLQVADEFDHLMNVFLESVRFGK